jgi:hypothetical protein
MSKSGTTDLGSINVAIGIDGQPAPDKAVEVAGIDPSGNLRPINVSGAGDIIVTGVVFEEAAGFGTLSPGYPTQISVGASASVELLPANPLRRYAHVFNNSAHKIYIQYSVPAALNQGIRLDPGNYFTLAGGDLWLGSVNAIALVSNQLIDVLEAI